MITFAFAGRWHRSFGRRLLLDASAVLGLLFVASACAATTAETLGSYQRTTFSRSENAPADIRSLAQTSDGFIWVSGTKGLIRFDGARFTAFRPLPGERFMAAQLGSLFPAQGGGLWIGNSGAGPTLLKNGHLVQFGEAQGYMGTGGSFMTDPQGAVWSVTNAAVMYFKHDRWHLFEPGVHEGRIFLSAAFDAHGNLWAAARNEGLLVARPGAAVVTRPWSMGSVRNMTFGRSGRMYVLTSDNGLHIFREEKTSLVEVSLPFPFFAVSVREDLGGGLWLALQDGRLCYISPAALALAEKQHAAPKGDFVPQVDGFPWPLLQDTDGNIWVGRNAGLDRFTLAAFTRITLPDSAHELSASVDASGGIWLGSESLDVMRLAPDASTWEDTSIPRFTLATYVDPSAGSVWAANPTGVWKLFPGTPARVVDYPQALVPYSVIRDRRNRLYVAAPRMGNGLMAWDGMSWHDVLREATVVKVMAVDQQDRLWAGSKQKNRLIELDQGVEHRWTDRDGLDVGAVRSILSDGERLWVGGDDGIQFFDGKRFTSLRARDPDVFQTVIGLVRDRQGNLWVQTLDAILRIPVDDVVKALAAADTRVGYRQFDAGDGVPEGADADRMLPSLRMSSDGRVWSHTSRGLAWIDPAAIRRAPLLPPIVVESLTSGTAVHDVSTDAVSLPPAHASFSIGYTIPALSHPERVHFSYRLDGFSGWEDAGSRREAFFTKVPPGHYRFQVRALGEEGLASVASTPMTLIRLPAWYQTWWFRALAALPPLLALWLVHRLRLRVLRRRLQIRIDERERIARDLHDTLLQGFQGLQLRLQTWAANPRLGAAHRQEVGDVAICARDMLVDGRDRIIALRHMGVATNFSGDLRVVGLEYSALYQVAFVLHETGLPVSLATPVHQEVTDIAREALRNAFVHAAASRVELLIDWLPHELQVGVRDDGRGIDETVLREGGRAGHWGLRGMRERAAGISARLDIRRRDEGGTELLLTAPARIAYASQGSWRQHLTQRWMRQSVKLTLSRAEKRAS